MSTWSNPEYSSNKPQRKPTQKGKGGPLRKKGFIKGGVERAGRSDIHFSEIPIHWCKNDTRDVSRKMRSEGRLSRSKQAQIIGNMKRSNLLMDLRTEEAARYREEEWLPENKYRSSPSECPERYFQLLRMYGVLEEVA